jgi:plastocyanin
MNWVRKKDVVLSFDDGETCILATDPRVGFKLDKEKDCLVTQVLSYGETVSLVFKTPGTYAYNALFEPGEDLEGKVIVE